MHLDHLQGAFELDLRLAPEQLLALVDRDAGERNRQRPVAVGQAQVDVELVDHARQGDGLHLVEQADQALLGEGEPSEGSTRVYIIDVISGHCGPNPGPNWDDVTARTYGSPNFTVGRWTIQPLH